VLLVGGGIHNESKVTVGSTPAQRRDGERIGVDFLGEQGDGCVGGLANDFG